MDVRVWGAFRRPAGGRKGSSLPDGGGHVEEVAALAMRGWLWLKVGAAIWNAPHWPSKAAAEATTGGGALWGEGKDQQEVVCGHCRAEEKGGWSASGDPPYMTHLGSSGTPPTALAPSPRGRLPACCKHTECLSSCVSFAHSHTAMTVTWACTCTYYDAYTCIIEVRICVYVVYLCPRGLDVPLLSHSPWPASVEMRPSAGMSCSRPHTPSVVPRGSCRGATGPQSGSARRRRAGSDKDMHTGKLYGPTNTSLYPHIQAHTSGAAALIGCRDDPFT